MQNFEAVNPFTKPIQENGNFLSNLVLDEPFESEASHYPEDTIVEPRGLTKNKKRTTAEDTIVEAKGPVFRDKSAIARLDDDILKPEEKEKLGMADTLHVSNEPVVSTRPKELETEPFQETPSFILPPDMEESFDLHNAGKRSESRHDDGIAWSELSREQRLNIVKEFRDYIASGFWPEGLEWVEGFVSPDYFKSQSFRQAAQKGILKSLKERHPKNAIQIVKNYLDYSDPILSNDEILEAAQDCYASFKEAHDRKQSLIESLEDELLSLMRDGANSDDLLLKADQLDVRHKQFTEKKKLIQLRDVLLDLKELFGEF